MSLFIYLTETYINNRTNNFIDNISDHIEDEIDFLQSPCKMNPVDESNQHADRV